MIDHDILMSAKTALIETVIKDTLCFEMLKNADPLAAFDRYTKLRMQPHPHPDPTLDAIRDEVWNEFADDIRRRLKNQLAERNL